MSKPYQLGIVPCTKTKHPTASTAQTLYRSGGFSLTMRHAQQRCDRVIIMSAKYGLLQLNDAVRYYDMTIAQMVRSEREALIEKLWHQMPRYAGERTLSYLPKLYYEVAHEALSSIASKWDRPYKHLGMLKLWAQLSQEIKDYEKNATGGGPQLPGVPRRRITPRPDEGS